MIVVRSAEGHLLWVAETREEARNRPAPVIEWGRFLPAKLCRVRRDGPAFRLVPLTRPPT